MKILQHGAEALIELYPSGIIKKRLVKSYRIPELDYKIRTNRTKKEARLLEKASQIISVPKLIDVFPEYSQIKMEYISGKKLSDYLDNLKNKEVIIKKVGREIAKLHDSNIIHGDLTTSNMILKQGKVYIIDFGLGFISNKTEDKAVDIHLLKQALEAKHFLYYEKLFRAFLSGYKFSKNFKETLARLKKVELRGRYKH
ncbi:MAG: KEOPS complex kinase/ATPase Bud32 [archaeon]